MSVEKKTNLALTGAQYGALAGIGCIIYTLILYLINVKLVLSFWIMLGYIIIIGTKIFAAYSVRRSQNNFISFKDGLKVTFMISVVGLLKWIVFNTILFLYVDTQLIDLSRQTAIERTQKIMEMSGASEETIDEVLEKVESEDYTPTLKTVTYNYASSLLVGFLFSMIIAGIFYLVSKENQPAVLPSSD